MQVAKSRRESMAQQHHHHHALGSPSAGKALIAERGNYILKPPVLIKPIHTHSEDLNITCRYFHQLQNCWIIAINAHAKVVLVWVILQSHN